MVLLTSSLAFFILLLEFCVFKLPILGKTDTIVIRILALAKTEKFANKFKGMQMQPFGTYLAIGVLVNFVGQGCKFF